MTLKRTTIVRYTMDHSQIAEACTEWLRRYGVDASDRIFPYRYDGIRIVFGRQTVGQPMCDQVSRQELSLFECF